MLSFRKHFLAFYFQFRFSFEPFLPIYFFGLLKYAQSNVNMFFLLPQRNTITSELDKDYIISLCHLNFMK